MPRYHIFLGAPSSKDIHSNKDTQSQWHVFEFPSEQDVRTLPPATLEAVSRRISVLYENIIFHEDDEEPEDISEQANEEERDPASTVITWPPTQGAEQYPHSKSAFTFLRATTSISVLHPETQETQDSGSYDYSDVSSVARFPAFHFNLHSVTSLATLSNEKSTKKSPSGSRKVNVLVAILEVEGPDTIRVKQGVDAGKEVALLKLIIGDEDGSVFKLTAWREVAESWGGSIPEQSVPGVKKGDIVLLENVLASVDLTNPSMLALTASPNLKSSMEICFRTMPNSPEDARFRPDLRLGFSDSAVRKVASVVAWFESVAGLRSS
ncbi:hypothetical protein K474DRAFT_1645534 [Panus rudis PR-1116 ss-1]|nr:hypothetical protein K474DRAFT_1645534 [Panus rudis PR-1116 ss-1]